MKAILMSIQPKWASKILSGEKTIEVRKTAPKEVPFKVYIYCTKGQELWGDGTGDTWKGIAEDECLETVFSLNPTLSPLNGKVVAEFVCEKVDSIINYGNSFGIQGQDEGYTNSIAGASCLGFSDLRKYLQDKNGYALHISNLKIYDKPKDLRDFKRPCIMPEMPYCPSCRYGCTTFPEDTTKQDLIDGCECEWGCLNTVTRPPQNYIYVEEL